MPWSPSERRDPLAATLDQGRPTGEEERDVRSEPGGDARAARPASSSAPQASSAPSIAAAASDEPPASPAATGMRFSSRAARGGAGPGPPDQPPPTAHAVAASARSTRLSASGPASSAGHVERVAVAAGGRARG